MKQIFGFGPSEAAVTASRRPRLWRGRNSSLATIQQINYGDRQKYNWPLCTNTQRLDGSNPLVVAAVASTQESRKAIEKLTHHINPEKNHLKKKPDFEKFQ